MTTTTINPENWVHEGAQVKVSDEGDTFEIYGYQFRVEKKACREEDEEYIPVESTDEADLVEYYVYSDDETWSDEYFMVKGAYWPAVYKHEDVVMYAGRGFYERRADSAWKAAAKVLANTI